VAVARTLLTSSITARSLSPEATAARTGLLGSAGCVADQIARGCGSLHRLLRPRMAWAIRVEEALNCVGFGLSSSCRLAVTYRGSTPTSWAVQSRQGSAWKTDSVTGMLIVPFWRRPRVVFKQNDLVASGSEGPR
jgi:hypothetical protein